MYPFDRPSPIGFNLNPLNRLSEMRHDQDYVAARREEESTRFFLFVGGIPVLAEKGNTVESLFTQRQATEWGEPLADIFLGQGEDGTALFALAFDKARADSVATVPGLVMVDLRSIALRGLVPPPLLGELGGANAMLNWHHRHQFCASCGAPSRISSAGWRRDCDACGAQHFPRVDPVVIMLAIDGDRCLLGRQQRFAAGMYSALAGFLEPGETIEAAVRREIHEESGIACSHVSYFASQPWPFPSSLMIGCFARALDTDIVVDTTELEDARWFSRAEVADMLAGTHPAGISAPKPYAIAYHLLKAFADDLPGLLPSIPEAVHDSSCSRMARE